MLERKLQIIYLQSANPAVIDGILTKEGNSIAGIENQLETKTNVSSQISSLLYLRAAVQEVEMLKSPIPISHRKPSHTQLQNKYIRYENLYVLIQNTAYVIFYLIIKSLEKVTLVTRVITAEAGTRFFIIHVVLQLQRFMCSR